jgi:hypothetical protein
MSLLSQGPAHYRVNNIFPTFVSFIFVDLIDDRVKLLNGFGIKFCIDITVTCGVNNVPELPYLA